MHDLDGILTTLRKVEDVSSRSAKEEIITTIKASEFVRFFFSASMDPWVQYHVQLSLKDLNGSKFNGASEWHRGWWDELKQLLTILASREVGRKEGLKAIRIFLSRTPSHHRWCLLAILNKRGLAGVSRKTVDKLFPGLIRWFDLQLCGVYRGVLERPMLCEPKLDGLRGVVGPFGSDGQVVALSRNGKPLYNVDHVLAALRPFAQHHVVDGEFFSEDWNQSMSLLKSRDATESQKEAAKRLKFYAFDTIKYEHWNKQSCDVPLSTRQRVLDRLVDAFNDVLVHVPSILVEDAEEAKMVTVGYLEHGYEGSVLKDPDSMYQFHRTDDWMKYKPMMEGGPSQSLQLGIFKVCAVDLGFRHKVTMAVHDLHEIDEDRQTLKSYDLVVRRVFVEVSEDGTMCAVGGGFSLEDRISMARVYKSQPMKVLGSQIRVAFQGRTPDGMLRFPEYQGPEYQGVVNN